MSINLKKNAYVVQHFSPNSGYIYVSTNVFNIDEGPGLSIIGIADFIRKAYKVSDEKLVVVYHLKSGERRDSSNLVGLEIRDRLQHYYKSNIFLVSTHFPSGVFILS